MARVRDVVIVMREVGPWTFLKRVYAEISNDNVFTLASALAYSWLFAIFPFMIFVLSLIPYLPQRYKTGAEDRIQEQLSLSQLPQPAQQVVMENVKNVLHDHKGGSLLIGILLTIYAASGGMAATMSALDAAYDVPRSRPFWKQRLIAYGLTVIAAVLILSVLVLLPVGTLVVNLFAKYGQEWLTWAGLSESVSSKLVLPIIVVGQILRYLLALMLMFGLLAVLYHFAPNIKQRFRFVTPGAVFVVVVWLALGFAFRWYINAYGEASYAKTYGTVAGVAILLLLFYLDALVLLVGAEINSEIDLDTRGTKGELTDPNEAAAQKEIAQAKAELAQRTEDTSTVTGHSAT